MRIIEKAYKDGLSAKTFSVRPYAELYAEFISREVFESFNRGNIRAPWYASELEFSTSDELAWRQSPGPGYTTTKSRKFIENRYKNAIKPIKLAIAKLLQHEPFRAFVRGLRQEGYRDWHILVLMHNLILNSRVHKRIDRRGSMKAMEVAMKEEMGRVEQPDDAMPPLELFGSEQITLQKQFTWVAIAKTWGLLPPRQTPDLRAFEKLLIVRYRCFEDDIPHDDPFPGCKQSKGPCSIYLRTIEDRPR